MSNPAGDALPDAGSVPHRIGTDRVPPRCELWGDRPMRQGRVKVAEKAALPPAVRKASGFPAQTASLFPLGSAGRLSLPAEPRGLVRAEAVGKAKPFRTAGGRAALGCYLSGTLTRPCPDVTWTDSRVNGEVENGASPRSVAPASRVSSADIRWGRNPNRGGTLPLPSIRRNFVKKPGQATGRTR